MLPGESVLETLRRHNVPHAAMCGGKARCTTCRVRVLEGHHDLPPPQEPETHPLDRIGAPAEVRLACQLRPQGNLTVVPLLPADATMDEGQASGGLDGREAQVVVVFVDLRDSTRLGEQRMPFDVLFVLNRFFMEMTRAIERSNGHYSNFTGDGLMALYGLDHDNHAQAAQEAVQGARHMVAALTRINRDLAMELTEPLRMGIGIHVGEAIVGSMGPPSSQIVSAIGDTVNTTARLESLNKDLDSIAVLSCAVADLAGLDLPAASLRRVTVKGRQAPIDIHVLTEL